MAPCACPRVGDRGHVLLRDQQDVRGRLRVEVAEGHTVGLVQRSPRGSRAPRSAEDAGGVGHAPSLVPGRRKRAARLASVLAERGDAAREARAPRERPCGVTTCTVTNRSPRRAAAGCGTPLPFSRTTVPDSVPASTSTVSVAVEPLDVDLGAERGLRHRDIEHAEQILFATVEHPVSPRPRSCTNRSPAEPPALPACPASGTRSSIPSETPAGISTETSLGRRTRPSPMQSSHGSGIS